MYYVHSVILAAHPFNNYQVHVQKSPEVAEFSDMNMVYIEVFNCIVILHKNSYIFTYHIISFYTFSDIYVCVYVL